MPVSRSSKPSRRSERRKAAKARTERPSFWPAAIVVAALAALSAAAIRVCLTQGWILYWGDALAHLNIARRVVDSRSPEWYQIGTVWLPLPHLLMLPLVGDDGWWRSGLAGSIPSGACYVLAGLFLFLAVRRAFASAAAGVTACLLLALNPNLLYLQSIPMTESLFLACLTGLLYFGVLFRDADSLWAAAGAGVCALAGTLTRYEGWFLIPFTTGYFLIAGKRHRFLAAGLVGGIASLGPLGWFIHNWWYWGDWLEFYRGPYSARAIYERALAAGVARYPGDHDWPKAWQQFGAAAAVVAGAPLTWIGLIGLIGAALKRAVWPLLLLILVPLFYVWSVHSSAVPIYVPHLWPNSYYNTRYAIGALPLLALGGAAIVAWIPGRWKGPAAGLIVAAALLPWLAYPRANSWVCWKESQVNSEARREWTRQAAEYLGPRYRPRDGIFSAFGDQAGIYLKAGIPLREVLHDGILPQYYAAVNRPDLFLRETWVVTLSGDEADRAITRTRRSGPRYDLVKSITIKGAPVVSIYRRVR